MVGGASSNTWELEFAVPGLTVPWSHAIYIWLAAAVSVCVHEVTNPYLPQLLTLDERLVGHTAIPHTDTLSQLLNESTALLPCPGIYAQVLLSC